MIKIAHITSANQQALALKNEPFTLFATLSVTKTTEKWQYQVCPWPKEQIQSETFPEENYALAVIDKQGFAIGAFDKDQAVGLAIFENQPFHYLYLSDLKIASQYRHQHLATKLLEKACVLAKDEGYQGLTTIGQSNNVAACLFYLSFGFEIGGLDTKVYSHTTQAGKEDVLFYYDF